MQRVSFYENRDLYPDWERATEIYNLSSLSRSAVTVTASL